LCNSVFNEDPDLKALSATEIIPTPTLMKTSHRILLVEDDKDDQDFFIDAMNDIGSALLYDIVNNGKEAIERLKDSGRLPTLIFMDINMPLMNGMQCLEAMRKNPDTMNIPVVILSTSPAQKEQAQYLGANAYIEKSSNYKTLRCQLEEMINLDFIKDKFIANQTFQNGLAGNTALC